MKKKNSKFIILFFVCLVIGISRGKAIKATEVTLPNNPNVSSVPEVETTVMPPDTEPSATNIPADKDVDDVKALKNLINKIRKDGAKVNKELDVRGIDNFNYSIQSEYDSNVYIIK